MTKNMLTYLSHQFCVNCCGYSKKLDCDTRYTTCDKLAGFLVSCKVYQEPIDKDKLDALADDYYLKQTMLIGKAYRKHVRDIFIDGYRKAMEGKE